MRLTAKEKMLIKVAVRFTEEFCKEAKNPDKQSLSGDNMKEKIKTEAPSKALDPEELIIIEKFCNAVVEYKKDQEKKTTEETKKKMLNRIDEVFPPQKKASTQPLIIGLKVQLRKVYPAHISETNPPDRTFFSKQEALNWLSNLWDKYVS